MMDAVEVKDVTTGKPKSWFTHFASRIARATGRPATFALAASVIVVWIITCPIFGFSDTWQLVINTGTTIVTFLMVFLIQNTQNRDSEAIQIKLDEVLRAIEGAHNELIDLEEMDEEQLDHIRARYEKLAETARRAMKSGANDMDSFDPSANDAQGAQRS